MLYVRQTPRPFADGHAQGAGQVASRLCTVVQRAGRHFGRASSRRQNLKQLEPSLKKTYTLNIQGKNRDRLLDASKHDIRKYVKRERAKPLPEGVDFLDFDCKAGASDKAALPVHFAEIMVTVDALVKDGADQFYVEITSKPGHRAARPLGATDSENAPEVL